MSVIRVEVEPPVAWVVLNRPGEGNPIDDALAEALREAWDDLAQDVRVRAIGIAATGPAFSVGVAAGSRVRTDRFGPKSCACSVPVLVALDGDVASGAFQLLGEADVIVSAPDVHLTVSLDPDAHLDVIDLQSRLPGAEVRRLALLGSIEHLTAQRAAQLGLIDELVPRSDLDRRSRELLAALAASRRRA